MPRPGIMLYFDNLDPLRQLSNEDLGKLFFAILEYGHNGKVPQFDGMLAMAWAFLQPKIDRDGQRYAHTVSSRRYGPYCREAARRGETPVSHEYWNTLSEVEQKRLITGDIICYPTAATTATASATVSTAAASTKSDHRRCQVTLSPYNMDTLRAKMGEETLQRYLDKLSNLIATDPTYDGNHYLTILEWWCQGCQD